MCMCSKQYDGQHFKVLNDDIVYILLSVCADTGSIKYLTLQVEICSQSNYAESKKEGTDLRSVTLMMQILFGVTKI